MAQTSAKPALGEATKKSLADAYYDDIAELYATKTDGVLIDEDSFATNSATRPPSQQSVKEYVTANSGGLDTHDTATSTGASITSSTYADLSGCTVTLGSVDSTSAILVNASGYWKSANATTLWIKLKLDGSSVAATERKITSTGNSEETCWATQHIFAGHGGGSVTCKVEVKVSSGTWTELRSAISAISIA